MWLQYVAVLPHHITMTLEYDDNTTVLWYSPTSGTATGFEMPSLLLNDTSRYTVSLEATNGAGLQRLVVTEVGSSSTVYAGLVEVVVNYARTENISGEFAEPEKLWSGEDFVCLLDTDVISVMFSAPLSEQEVDTDR